MSEKDRAEAIQDVLQDMDEFADSDVVINDMSVLDRASAAYAGNNIAIIHTSDNFVARQPTRVPQTDWDIPVTLAKGFEDWDTTMTGFMDLRQAVIDKFNLTTESNRTDDGVYIPEIRSETPIDAIYDQFVDFNNPQNSVPDFLIQRIIFVTEEY